MYEKHKNNADFPIEEAQKYIERCLQDTKNVEPEFIDTYVSILELKEDTEKIIEVINQFYLMFPDSEMMIKLIEKYKT